MVDLKGGGEGKDVILTSWKEKKGEKNEKKEKKIKEKKEKEKDKGREIKSEGG